jgi:hypothetical protein
VIIIWRREGYFRSIRGIPGVKIPSDKDIDTALEYSLGVVATPLASDAKEFGMGTGSLEGVEFRQSALNTWDLVGEFDWLLITGRRGCRG